MSRPPLDKLWLETAHLMSLRSTCPKQQVGAVVVSPDRQIVSVGWNGAPPGMPHCTEVGCQLNGMGECIRAIHAESNALWYAGRESKGATLYLTLSPCQHCANLIVRAGIMCVIYDRPWEGWRRRGIPDPIKTLEQADIVVYRESRWRTW